MDEDTVIKDMVEKEMNEYLESLDTEVLMEFQKFIKELKEKNNEIRSL